MHGVADALAEARRWTLVGEPKERGFAAPTLDLGAAEGRDRASKVWVRAADDILVSCRASRCGVGDCGRRRRAGARRERRSARWCAQYTDARSARRREGARGAVPARRRSARLVRRMAQGPRRRRQGIDGSRPPAASAPSRSRPCACSRRPWPWSIRATTSAKARPTRRMWASWLLVKGADGWRIGAIRNMLPAPPVAAR